MTKALIVQLADDVVDQLNKKQGGWTVKFKAERKYLPKEELEQTDSVVARVAIAAWRVTPDNRTDWEHQYDIDIGVMYRASSKAGDEPTAQFDEVLRLAEEISDYWEETRPTVADCPLMAISFGPSGDAPYLPDHINRFNQITTVIKLTFWKLR